MSSSSSLATTTLRLVLDLVEPQSFLRSAVKIPESSDLGSRMVREEEVSVVWIWWGAIQLNKSYLEKPLEKAI